LGEKVSAIRNLMPAWCTPVQKDLGRMLRMALWVPVFAALFGPVSDRAAGVHTVYYTFLRVRSAKLQLCCGVVMLRAISQATMD
jgi:hypothetical protein